MRNCARPFTSLQATQGRKGQGLNLPDSINREGGAMSLRTLVAPSAGFPLPQFTLPQVPPQFSISRDGARGISP